MDSQVWPLQFTDTTDNNHHTLEAQQSSTIVQEWFELINIHVMNYLAEKYAKNITVNIIMLYQELR